MGLTALWPILDEQPSYEQVCNKETNQQMQGKNIRSGQDSNVTRCRHSMNLDISSGSLSACICSEMLKTILRTTSVTKKQMNKYMAEI